MMIIFFKKIFSWLKNYWWIPAIAILIVIYYIAFQKSPDALINVIKNSQSSHKKEIDIINKSHEEEIKKREEAIKIYNKTIENIERKYIEDSKNLDDKKRKQIKSIIKESNNDQEKITKMLADKMGFEIVE